MPITDPDKVKKTVGWQPDGDEDVFQESWEAAEGYVAKRCRWPQVDDNGDPVPPPAELVRAVSLLTSRYLDRRNSPNGLVGLGELGVASVPTQDADVRTLIGPYRKVTV